MYSIETKDLTKKFGDFTAVNSVSVKIKEGELFGLLGPNGAGKTTLLNMLSTILTPTEGSSQINGRSIQDQDAVRRSIGMVFQDNSLDDELTGRENLDFHGRLYHMSRELRMSRIEEVLELVDLKEKADSLVRTYSGGMRRRIEIARGLMHHPKVLFLDEPTLGLDPQTRRNIWDYIRKLNEKEKLTIILTTHYMEEADNLCDRIAIIDKGQIIALDTPKNLKNVIGGDLLIVETSNAEELKKHIKFKSQIIDKSMRISVKNAEKTVLDILEIARKRKIKIESVNIKKPTLEDVFVHYTGHEIRQESASAADVAKRRMKYMMRR
ncbi:MAG: ATP-binding cassette domain-containing protein [Candidatus Aenigmarchaeota archaeon]|nr:ATP-binding cassette domain-containing protein [Candidatus Aenigmarchaeota archaeon]